MPDNRNREPDRTNRERNLTNPALVQIRWERVPTNPENNQTNRECAVMIGAIVISGFRRLTSADRRNDRLVARSPANRGRIPSKLIPATGAALIPCHPDLDGPTEIQDSPGYRHPVRRHHP
jgi:hypothetical protein